MFEMQLNAILKICYLHFVNKTYVMKCQQWRESEEWTTQRKKTNHRKHGMENLSTRLISKSLFNAANTCDPTKREQWTSHKFQMSFILSFMCFVNVSPAASLRLQKAMKGRFLGEGSFLWKTSWNIQHFRNLNAITRVVLWSIRIHCLSIRCYNFGTLSCK